MNPTTTTGTRLDRRTFLQAAGLGLAGATLGLPRAARADFNDYRALVCVFLFGGNDAFNMVVPRSQAEYDVYAASRQNLAIDRDVLLPISPLTPDGAEYGLHPRLTALKPLFDAGELAIVANTGPLVEPITRDQFLAKAVPVPPQLFSHNDQQDQWQTARGMMELRTGWAGRTADLLGPRVASQMLPLNISLAGTTVFQIGADGAPYAISENGAPNFVVLTDPQAGLYAERRAMFERLLALGYPSPITRSLTAVQQRSLDLADIANAALANAQPITTAFPASSLAGQLEAVARLISVRDRLQMQRQVFLVAAGGFDTHDNQNQLQPDLLGDVSDSMAAFHAALTELGVAQDVVTFTQSDFGRTLTSNGDGTDHGWGAHQLVLGGSVAGREIYGTMPRLEIGGPDDATGGRIIPTQSVDQYAATLLGWFGLADSELDLVLPNLGNFAERNLGFV